MRFSEIKMEYFKAHQKSQKIFVCLFVCVFKL